MVMLAFTPLSRLIASNQKQFAEFSIELMNNDILWCTMRNHMLNLRGIKNSLDISKKFLVSIKR